MNTRTIPADEWIAHFDRFSRDHLGWAAIIAVLDQETGPQQLAENLPFQGISFDTKGSRPNTIEVSVGDGSGRHLNHVVPMPLNIREADEANGSVDIQIEPATGPVTLLHLRGPVH